VILPKQTPKQKKSEMHEQKSNTTHTPVLLSQTLQYLAPRPGESYLDLTAGYGGHAGAILERTKNPVGIVLVDRDQTAITSLKDTFGKDVDIRHSDFYAVTERLLQEGRRFDMILADLGVSSLHLDNASRGFAFMQTGPLDMRMDQSRGITAEEMVNTYSEDELITILKRYGEEPKAKRIAKLIIEHRPIKTTEELAKVVTKAYPGRSRTHPATRTFQALRIAVNDELGQLERALPLWCQLLAPRGRLGVISFHSLEDRIVKNTFKELAGDRYDAELRLVSKKPIVGDKNEIVSNPRARSAKLRVSQRK
jgi:16S rRNA (cytosine1402-N4)-methyltransferase